MSKERSLNVYAKKKYGQNFLKDEGVLKKIVETSGIDQDTLVIEIGPGLGALTKHLCSKAGFVLAYEIDESLIPLLIVHLAEYRNYEIIHQDILKSDLKTDINRYQKDYKHIKVVANLPYYITTPIILSILSLNVVIDSITVMMQLEVADRICGKPSTKDYNALSVLIAYRGIAKKVMKVPRTSFVPSPNVDSAVVHMLLYDKLPLKPVDEDLFLRIIRLAFTQRRKTLYNNLSLEYDKEFVLKMLNDLNYIQNIRAESLELKDYILISDYISNNYVQ